MVSMIWSSARTHDIWWQWHRESKSFLPPPPPSISLSLLTGNVPPDNALPSTTMSGRTPSWSQANRLPKNATNYLTVHIQFLPDMLLERREENPVVPRVSHLTFQFGPVLSALRQQSTAPANVWRSPITCTSSLQ